MCLLMSSYRFRELSYKNIMATTLESIPELEWVLSYIEIDTLTSHIGPVTVTKEQVLYCTFCVFFNTINSNTLVNE